MRKILALWRMMLFIGLTLGLYGTWFVGSPFVPNRIRWRQLALELWSRGFVRISRMKVRIVGTIPTPPFFLVSNHLSYTDIPVIRSVVDCVFVAKGEIEGWALAGRITTDMGTIFIDRQNRRDIPRAGQKILDAFERGEGVLVFPEGTSAKGEEVLPFKSSFLEFAAQGNLPVHYAAITYQTPPGEAPAHLAVCWWEDISFMQHLWRFFQTKSFEAIVHFGEMPVQSENRKLLAQELWEEVSERFVPVL